MTVAEDGNRKRDMVQGLPARFQVSLASPTASANSEAPNTTGFGRNELDYPSKVAFPSYFVEKLASL